jgi:hypothetical protein
VIELAIAAHTQRQPILARMILALPALRRDDSPDDDLRLGQSA